MLRNSSLIEKTVEITVAKLNCDNTSANQYTGEAVSDFMQKVYDKLVELNNSETD